MNGKTAALTFLASCVIVAALLLLQVIPILVGSILFAAALAVLGGISGGFRKR